MASDFLRFEEHYESPKFKGKVFTRSQFNAWYRKSKGKQRSTYATDWSGFNVPGWVFREFKRNSGFLPFSKEEQKLVDLLWTLPYGSYVIATAAYDEKEYDTFTHEMAHGFFATNETYRRQVIYLYDKFNCPALHKLCKMLLKSGYDQSVLLDEIQAYLIADASYLASEGINVASLDEFRYELVEYYAKTRLGRQEAA